VEETVYTFYLFSYFFKRIKKKDSVFGWESEWFITSLVRLSPFKVDVKKQHTNAIIIKITDQAGRPLSKRDCAWWNLIRCHQGLRLRLNTETCFSSFSFSFSNTLGMIDKRFTNSQLACGLRVFFFQCFWGYFYIVLLLFSGKERNKFLSVIDEGEKGREREKKETNQDGRARVPSYTFCCCWKEEFISFFFEREKQVSGHVLTSLLARCFFFFCLGSRLTLPNVSLSASSSPYPRANRAQTKESTHLLSSKKKETTTTIQSITRSTKDQIRRVVESIVRSESEMTPRSFPFLAQTGEWVSSLTVGLISIHIFTATAAAAAALLHIIFFCPLFLGNYRLLGYSKKKRALKITWVHTDCLGVLPHMRLAQSHSSYVMEDA